MAETSRRVVRSWSHERLIAAAAEFISRFPESLLLTPRVAGASPLLGRMGGAGLAGVHHRTLTQLASELARPAMAERHLAPLSSLAMEAVTARVAHEALARLKYFGPVAKSPGFPRALARTLSDLRLAGVRPEEVEPAGEPGRDVALLLA